MDGIGIAEDYPTFKLLGKKKKVTRIFLKIILFILSVLYRLSVKIRHTFTKSRKLEIKVISIGNITVGGTGKTTVVMSLAKELAREKKVAVLSRGYGRKIQDSRFKIQDSCIISDGEKIFFTPEETGDEPYLLASKLKGVPVIIGKNRYESGLLAKEKFNSEVAILDDGFQHWSLKRDLDIVCLDSLTPLENEPLFPLGTLREPLSGLKRANLILLTNINLITLKELKEWYQYLKRICPQVLIVESIFQPLGLHLLANNLPILETDFLQNKEVILLSSVGNPYAFEKTVEKLGAKVIERFNFPDHHWYREEDFSLLPEGEDLIITTAKDEVKLKKFISPELDSFFKRIYILEIELKILRGKEIWEEKIKQVCG